MSSNTTDTADAIFWKAYGAAIKKAIGQVTINDTTSFYLSTTAQRGPPGGDNISDRYTNEGIYQIGNNLLPPDQLFYSPSSQNSYIRQIQTYLAWVDVGGTPSSPNIAQVTNTREDMEAANNYQLKQQDQAYTSYQKQVTMGMTGGLTFPQWVQQNAPGYNAAKQAWQAKVAAYQKAFKNAYGPLADQKLADESKINSALATSDTLPGYTMDCALGAPPSARDFDNASNNGTTIPPPAVVKRPAFNAPNYIGAIKDAQALVGTQHDPKHTTMIHFNDGQNVSDSEFSKTVGNAGIGFTYFPWISFSASAGTSVERSSVSTASDASDITVTLTYDDMSLVSVNPSASWDIGDVRTKYKNLLPGAPKDAQILVKPTQMLLATRLGYKVKLGASSSQQFDTAYQRTTSGGGSIYIFGIPCNVGGNVTSTQTENTHNLKWNSTNQEFTVEPTDNCGFATIVGVIGEKITTAA